MICAKDLTFEIGKFRLDGVSIETVRDEYFVLLGPPGSGKSIFLECLCGLRKVKSGRILIDGKDITDSEPRKRHIGYVPQDYALFPHLTVGQNIAFGLRASGCGKKAALAQACETAEMLGIGHLLGRNVLALSGGEKQRTALARALVMKPEVLLLDEPVCALDEATRHNICSMLRGIQKEFALTVMHVSHNLEEAFSVADRAAILNEGRLQQMGPLDELLRRPSNEFVARFMRCENIYSAKVVRSLPGQMCTEVRVGDITLVVKGIHADEIKIIIRPEDVTVVSGEAGIVEEDNKLSVSITGWRDFGSFARVNFSGAIDLVGHLPHRLFAKLKVADAKGLTAVLPRESIHVLG
jgi:ABC-type Fe3+/spermidine/putrescine transport system ATPase subunit